MGEGAYEFQGAACFDLVSEEVNCHADGETFTWTVEGFSDCTGGTSTYSFTASEGAVGEDLCFTMMVNDDQGGFCCSTQVCVPVPDCSDASQITMTFEEFLGSDVAPIATFYDGITFESGGSGSDWVARDGSTGNYNISSWPSGDVLGSDGNFWIFDLVAATTALDATGNDGAIRFDNADATFVEVGYCSANDFFLEAYAADDNLLDVDSGPPNLRIGNGNENGPGILRVDWDGETHIAYVIVHDEGNFWILDNITTDATGIIVDCPADLNGDGFVNVIDLLMLIGSFGPCEGCPADFGDDGFVGVLDLLEVLGQWGVCSP